MQTLRTDARSKNWLIGKLEKGGRSDQTRRIVVSNVLVAANSIRGGENPSSLDDAIAVGNWGEGNCAAESDVPPSETDSSFKWSFNTAFHSGKVQCPLAADIDSLLVRPSIIPWHVSFAAAFDGVMQELAPHSGAHAGNPARQNAKRSATPRNAAVKTISGLALKILTHFKLRRSRELVNRTAQKQAPG